MKKRIIALILAAIMLLAFAACGGEKTETKSGTKPEEKSSGQTEVKAEETPGKEKVLKVAMTTSMGDLDPFNYTSPGANLMRFYVYDYLAVFSEFGQSWEEMSWEIAKNITQVDNTTYDIEIYDYVYDAIGNHITAEDVAYCFCTMRDNGQWSKVTRYVDDAVPTGDYTIRLTLKSDVVGVLEYLMCQTRIVSRKTYEENKDKMSTTPITTAAYQITECVEGSSYTVEKNPNYWQTDESLRSIYAQQPVDKIIYNVITEASQATIALEMGDVDVISSCKTSELGYFVKDDGTAMEGYSINAVPETSTPVVMFNMDEEYGKIFKDNLALRQAFLYAIDNEGIIKGALNGYGVVKYDPAPTASGDFIDEWIDEDYYNFDLDKANALMEEAGYKDGIDPTTGRALHIRFLTDATREKAATIIQSQLMKIGVDVEIILTDDSTFSQYHFDPTQWDFAIAKQGVETYITNLYDLILLKDKNGRSPKMFVVDDKLEELIQTAHNVETHTPANIDAMHDYVKDNAYLYGLYTNISYTVAREGITIFNHPWGYFIPSACTFDSSVFE